MSELPTIDPLKVAQRSAQKYRSELAESKDMVTQLEILAEALRDERDEAVEKLGTANARIAELEASPQVPVEDITSLPK